MGLKALELVAQWLAEKWNIGSDAWFQSLRFAGTLLEMFHDQTQLKLPVYIAVTLLLTVHQLWSISSEQNLPLVLLPFKEFLRTGL